MKLSAGAIAATGGLSRGPKTVELPTDREAQIAADDAAIRWAMHQWEAEHPITQLPWWRTHPVPVILAAFLPILLATWVADYAESGWLLAVVLEAYMLASVAAPACMPAGRMLRPGVAVFYWGQLVVMWLASTSLIEALHDVPGANFMASWPQFFGMMGVGWLLCVGNRRYWSRSGGPVVYPDGTVVSATDTQE